MTARRHVLSVLVVTLNEAPRIPLLKGALDDLSLPPGWSLETILVGGYAYVYYGYRPTPMVFRYAAVQMLIGFTAYGCSLLADGWLYWITEAALTLVSTAYSVHILRHKTHLWESLKRKLGIQKSEE